MTPMSTSPVWAGLKPLGGRLMDLGSPQVAEGPCLAGASATREEDYLPLNRRYCRTPRTWLRCRRGMKREPANGVHAVGDVVPRRQCDVELPGLLRHATGLRGRLVRPQE